MKPIYTITDKILSAVSEASLLLGRLQATSGIGPHHSFANKISSKQFKALWRLRGIPSASIR